MKLIQFLIIEPFQPMHQFIIKHTAKAYFSNLVWCIRNHALDLDTTLKSDTSSINKNQLTDLIDEYVDHLNYIQDILKLNIRDLNDILIEELIKRFFIPICLHSLTAQTKVTKIIQDND